MSSNDGEYELCFLGRYFLIKSAMWSSFGSLTVYILSRAAGIVLHKSLNDDYNWINFHFRPPKQIKWPYDDRHAWPSVTPTPADIFQNTPLDVCIYC